MVAIVCAAVWQLSGCTRDTHPWDRCQAGLRTSVDIRRGVFYLKSVVLQCQWALCAWFVRILGQLYYSDHVVHWPSRNFHYTPWQQSVFALVCCYHRAKLLDACSYHHVSGLRMPAASPLLLVRLSVGPVGQTHRGAVCHKTHVVVWCWWMYDGGSSSNMVSYCSRPSSRPTVILKCAVLAMGTPGDIFWIIWHDNSSLWHRWVC